MIENRTAEQYIAAIRDALKANPHAVEFYFPRNEKRAAMSLRLAREIGYGLAEYDGGEAIVPSTYGQLVVAFSLDTTGVAVDAHDWAAAMRGEMARAQRERRQ